MEELTNIKVEWVILPADNPLDQVNIWFAAGDSLPEVIYGAGIPSTSLITWGSAKQIIPLQDLIEEHGHNLKKLFAHDPSVYPSMTSADGNVYSISDLGNNTANQVSWRFWVNQVFLDALGMKMPTTIDEYYQYLVAVKTRDPNGNGRADEVPLAAAATGGWNVRLEFFLMNAFTFDEPTRRMLLTDDGKVDVSYNKPGYREGLEFFARLFREGLVQSDSFTMTDIDVRNMVEKEGPPIVGSIPGGTNNTFSDVNGTRRRDFKIVAPLKGPKGVQWAY
jgi:putative aldouronate transport system substrate-binding protein